MKYQNSLRPRFHQVLWIWMVFAVIGFGYMPSLFAQDTAPESAAPESAANVSTPATASSVVRFSVDPPVVHLTTTRDYQTLVGQVELANGLTSDVTREMVIEVQPSELVQQDGNLLRPKQDGEGKVLVRYGEHVVEIPLVVRQAGETLPLSFRLDVMPVFMRSGCNTGSCHGAARGKDGFNLSLFGFDPAGDYNRLLREQLGRRIDLAFPERSLLLEKSIGAVSHSGGSLFKADSRYYQTLLEWLQNGAPDDPGAVAQVVKVELFPAGGVLNGPETTQQLTVVATYSDGTTRDVTDLAYFSSANDNSATVSQAGIVTAANRGEAFVMARYDTHTVGRHFIVLPKDLEFAWQDLPANNYIDEWMYEKWKRLRIEPSPLCDDATFLRRVSLDICGMLPTSEELATFSADMDPNKRARKIDELLERKEFVEMWVMKWAELLQIRSTINVSYKSALLYFNWLQQQIANDVPIDAMVRELLSSKGGTFSNPATNYYQMETDTLKVAENVAQVFMGMRTQCAQCHNHPFDRWTMDDYYSFAAFFSQVGRKQAEDPREVIVFNSGGGDVRHLVGGRVMTPKFLGGAQPEIQPGQDRRDVMAKWLASPENPFFARNLTNIVWAHFFGKGIVNDVDDVRVSNPAVNEQLLEALSTRFTDYKYDFKQLVRDICNSRTYQLSTAVNESNASDETNFSRRYLNRMRAEVMLDVISQVTDTGNKFRGLAYGARAVQIADGNTSNYFLTTFGRATRETVCSCEVVMEPNLSQALHLLNGETVHQKCREGGLIAKMIGEGQTPAAVITEIYQRAFSRKPQDDELQKLLGMVAESADVQDGLHDVFWAVLNSPEFMFNH